MEKLLNSYKRAIKDTHKLASLEDVEKHWGAYRSVDGSGLCFILRKSNDIPAKIAAYSESWARSRVLLKHSRGKITADQYQNFKTFISIPDMYGGLCPLIESDLTLGAFAGAFLTLIPSFEPVIFSYYPVPKGEIPPGNTLADKRFGIVLHELSHVACSEQDCKGMEAGHGGGQTVVENVLRDISAKFGLKPHNPNGH
jgi:hypothetical protein